MTNKKGLAQQISSDYINAANKLRGKNARRRIVAYVESYDDVLFWRMVLSRFEDSTRYFEVMLPSHSRLSKGKRQALLSLMEAGGGENLMACVDADYDYLLQGLTNQSRLMLQHPYVVHTHVYAIENYQCYAPSLHNVCVMATLNDHRLFDFEAYLSAYSRAVYPLLIWSVMLYGKRDYNHFSITDFNKVVSIRHSRLADMMSNVERLRGKIRQKIGELQRTCTGLKELYLETKDRMSQLGVTPDNAYLYVQGHHLMDAVVAPVVQSVCDELRRERERDIKNQSRHAVQMNNELSAYNNSLSDITSMLKKNPGYEHSLPFMQLLENVEQVLSRQK